MARLATKRVRAAHRLNALKVAKIRAAGLYEDGAGLRLVVTGKNTKRWVVRVTINGRRVERGLGVYPELSLEGARAQAMEFRRAAKEGRDVRAERKRVRRSLVSFEQAFDDFFEVRRQQLSNGKHVQQWQSTMRDYVFPSIGKLPVADVRSGEIIELLKPIWFEKPETASRVLQRLNAVFDSAILRGTRERANPCIGVRQELGTEHRTVKHFAALHWRDVPEFIQYLRSSQAAATTRLALEFLVLTATRSGDVRGALWSEIDLQSQLWTIPGRDSATGRRTKTGHQHVIPLSTQAIRLLAEARKLEQSQALGAHVTALIFPGTRGKPLSDNTFSKLMRTSPIHGTPHGFRSSFKVWCAERGIRDEVSEAALAHADANAVRAAYRRTQYVDERTELMQQWADLVVGPNTIETVDSVVMVGASSEENHGVDNSL